MTQFIGIDVGGTNIAGVMADGTGKIVSEGSIPTQAQEGPHRVIERIAEFAQTLAREAKSTPQAIGMGVPGLVDAEQGTTKILSLGVQWRDFPAGQLLSEQAGCPVFLINDAQAATLGEWTFGRGRGVTNMVLFTLGTGVGAGLVIDGKLHTGHWGRAGHLGHQTVLRDGPECSCGARGCLEAMAGGTAITREGVRLAESGKAPKLYDLVGGDLARINPEEMVKAAESGDESVREALINAATYLGMSVGNIVYALTPELVVIGGGVANIGPLLFDTVRAWVNHKIEALLPPLRIRIEPSQLGNNTGSLGAAAMAMRGGNI